MGLDHYTCSDTQSREVVIIEASDTMDCNIFCTKEIDSIFDKSSLQNGPILSLKHPSMLSSCMPNHLNTLSYSGTLDSGVYQ